MLVVATTLETDARSKMLAVVVACESGSKVKRPKARRATRVPRLVTAIEAAGNAFWLIAFWITSKA